MAADGYLNFDTKVDTSGFNKGTATITKQASKIGGVLSSALGTAIGFGAAQIATQVVQSLIRIGNQAIELSSDLEEVQNVVDTAFGEMAYKCEEFADIAIDSFGMSKLSAKQTASTYMAMAKSMGVSMDNASDMAVEVAKLTGDVASFYNISTDLASTKLKSIFTGETETLKDLGVVMTETNLQQYALQSGITKSYSAMSQAEKVALRYNFVMNSLADAQGDFARTSNSWANQTRVLSERWKELLGILGGGLIQVLTPVVKVINTILAALINLANAFANTIGKLFGLNTTVKASASTAIAAADSQGELADQTTKAGNAAKKSLAGFDELNVLQKETSSSSSGSSGVGDGSNMLDFSQVETPKADTKIFDDIGKSLERLKPYVDGLKDAWNNLKDAFERFYNSKGVQFIIEWLKEFYGYMLKSRVLPALINGLTGVLYILAGTLDIVAGALTVLIGIMTGDFEMAGEGMKQLGKGIGEVWEGLGKIIEGVLDLFVGEDIIGPFFDKMKKYFEKRNKGTTVWDTFKREMKELGEEISRNWNKNWGELKKDTSEAWESIVKTTSSKWREFKSTMSELNEEISRNLSESWNDLKTKTTDTWNNISAKVSETWNSVSTSTSEKWSAIKQSISTVATTIETNVSTAWGNVKSKTKTVFDSINSYLKGDFKKNWQNAWNGIKNVFKSVINTINSIFYGMINKIITAINWLIKQVNKISVPVPKWVTKITGASSFGFNIPTIKQISVPKLATGAVIPPNAEFAAILGDQKNGRNLEAPESLIRQIVREESMTASQLESAMYDALVRASDKISSTTIIEGDTDGIFKAVQKKANDYTYRTGKPAFI